MKTSITLNEIETEAVDESIVMFGEPLYIVGTRARQWNGTVYDLDTTDISQWDGTITADHSDRLQDVIGKAINLQRRQDGITISGIKYAIKENPLAVLAKNLLLGGFATGFSCETIGPDPDEEGVWHNHALCGLSQVSHPNDKLAYAVIRNSREEAKKLGWEEKEVNNSFNSYVIEDKVKNEMDAKTVEKQDVKNLDAKKFVDSVVRGDVLAIDEDFLRKTIYENEAHIIPKDGLGVKTAFILNNLNIMAEKYYEAYEENTVLSEEAKELLEEQKGYYIMFQRRAVAAANNIDEWAEEDYERLRKAIIPLAESHIDYLKKLAAEKKEVTFDYDSLLIDLKNLSAVEIRKDAEETSLENRAFVLSEVKEADNLIEKAKLSIITRKED